jgi:hypothetical protein
MSPLKRQTGQMSRRRLTCPFKRQPGQMTIRRPTCPLKSQSGKMSIGHTIPVYRSPIPLL